MSALVVPVAGYTTLSRFVNLTSTPSTIATSPSLPNPRSRSQTQLDSPASLPSRPMTTKGQRYTDAHPASARLRADNDSPPRTGHPHIELRRLHGTADGLFTGASETNWS